jgi:ADP-ribose pyrophosphatase
MPGDKVISSRSVFDGRVVHLRVETIQTADGETYEREVIRHLGAVALVPLEPDDTVILVRQFRAGADGEVLEIPAGTLNPGEDRLDCARRELQEEIGFYPEKLTTLGQFWVAASYTSELITIYVAEGLRPSRLPGDKDEDITVVRMPFEEALRMAYANEIDDSKTLIALMWIAQKRRQSGRS